MRLLSNTIQGEGALMATDPTPLGKYEIDGAVPVISAGSKCYALHGTLNKAGEARFALTEVVPSRMDGRTVAAWTGVFQGTRITFDTPVQAETFFRMALTALDSLKVKPRIETPLEV